MANLHLVTGYSGKEHITAVDQGAFNAALIGTGQFVLDKGGVFEAQVISNNQIRVLDGELMMQGRFIRLEPGTYVDLNIDSGTQGMQRNDLIVARYTKDAVTGVEGCNLVVIKGTAAASNPADPAFTEGDITNGAATQNDFPLWRIPISGINVGTPEALFGDPFMDSMRTLPEIRAAVNQIHKEVDKKIENLESFTKEETLTDETKALYGLGKEGLPDDVFASIKASLGNHANLISGKAIIETGSYVGTGGAITLTFNNKPQIVVISGMKYQNNTSGFMVVPRGATSAAAAGGGADLGTHAYISWGDKTVTVSGSSSYNPSVSGHTHYYAAITEGVAE